MPVASKYAFIPVPNPPAKETRLDFAEARKITAEHLKPDALASMYDAHERPRSRDQFPETFAELPIPDRAYIAWLYAGDVILDGLRLGRLIAYTQDTRTASTLAVPTQYWAQPGLEFPTASQVQFLTGEFFQYGHLSGATVYHIKEDLLDALGSSPRSKGGRTPAYDWAQFRSQLHLLLDHHGLPTVEDRDWKSQAAVERAMLDWCSREWGVEPSLTQVKKHVREGLQAFVRDRS